MADDRLEDAMDEVGEEVAAARRRFQRLAEDLEDKYRQVGEDVRVGAERARENVSRGARAARERYEEVARKARKGYHKVKSNLSDVSDEVGTYVRDNPGKSILIAAAVGFVVGLLVRRRSDD